MSYACDCVDMLCNRGYENVDWDSKLPPRHKPPTTTLEKMADPMSQRFVLKRYHSRPELWQVSLLHWKLGYSAEHLRHSERFLCFQAIGSHWNKHQLRATFNTRKPISL